MQNSISDIARLCESWWSCPRVDSPVEQRSHVLQFLALLDWDLPIPFSPGPAAEKAAALPYLLCADADTTIAAYFLRPGLLEQPIRLHEEKRDYSLLTRSLIAESDSPNIHYLFISDIGRSFLYHMPDGELLATADSPENFNRDLRRILRRGGVLQGALDGLPRPSRCARAKRLDQWREYWKRELLRGFPASDEAVDLLFDRLTLLRYIFPRDVFRRTRRRLQQRFYGLCRIDAPGDTRPAGDWGDQLRRLFHDMWLDWRIHLFAPHKELDALLSTAPAMPGLLQASLLLADILFTDDVILESFNNGDAREKMRVRMVPDYNEERELLFARQSVETLDRLQVEIQIRDEGYRAIPFWIDRIIQSCEEIDARYSDACQHNADREEDDLFAWSDHNSGRPDACTDPLGFICAQGVRVICTSPAQHRLALLLLTMRLVDLCRDKFPAREWLPDTAPVFTKTEKPLRDVPRIMLPPVTDLN